MAKSPKTFTSHSPPRARSLSGPATRRRWTRELLQSRNRAFGPNGVPTTSRQTSATRTDTTSRLPISLGSTNKGLRQNLWASDQECWLTKRQRGGGTSGPRSRLPDPPPPSLFSVPPGFPSVGVIAGRGEKQVHPTEPTAQNGFVTRLIPAGTRPDAAANYPQSPAQAQVFCLRHCPLGHRRRNHRRRSAHRATGQWPTRLLRLRSGRSGLRPLDRTPLPVRPLVGPNRILALFSPPGRLPSLWRQGGAGAVGRGQAPPDHDVYVVPGDMGQAAVLAGRGPSVRHQLEQRVPLGHAGRVVGHRQPSAGRDQGHRCR